ncbi:PREDICTED: uncharacterized protein LOC108568648 [Nicrophorus vespilloides]|uniref:Uncharacterized protein LOC108568648 n=1 Tax=Nicrophorus vespilloides TaxID=110193 RepID=A0ABM1NEU5_NICVS|nr:PREDICTED: uncharacterized protein LOC108568648 [Nicrophorus vespilloides]
MFSQIVGVCTISLSLQRKRLHVIHNAVLLLVFVGLSIYSFSAEKTVDHTKAPNVSIFREIVNRYLYFLLGIMFIAMGYFRANKLISFFKLIFEADRELLKISQFSDEASKKYLIALNVIGFGLCLAILGIALVTEELVLALVHFLFVSVVLATLGPLIGGLQLLRKRFECINSVLSNRAFRNYNNEKTIVTVGDKYRIIATCHDRLCDAAEALNSCYTIQLLGYFTLVFLGTLFAVFGDFRVFFGTMRYILWLQIHILKK